MFISPETADMVRDRAPIEEIVRRYVPTLKKKGRNHVGLCPFHKEDTPSFTVSAEKRMFYCFGCHAAGNVFSFVSRIENLVFPEAVKRVADMSGITIDSGSTTENRDREREFRLCREALELYKTYRASPRGSVAAEYLEKRGVTPHSMDAFDIGFAPDSWDFLKNSLARTPEDLAAAERIGLLSVSEKGGQKRLYDRFRNRVMFPIMDQTGHVVAFGGRVMDSGDPKYLNSPESDIFKKRTVLYGYHRAREAIQEYNRVVLVEGYLDVIGCHQAGITNVVAPLGTALTPDHIKTLARLCGEIILLFDADSAGMRAALRSLDVTGEHNIRVRVAVLPEGDPFDFVTTRGAREFMSLVDRAQDPVSFKIDRIMENAGGLDRVSLLMRLFAVIKEISYDTERQVYLKKLSIMLEVEEQALRRDFISFINNRKFGTAAPLPAGGAAPDRLDYNARGFRDLVMLLCHHPSLIEKAIIDFPEKDVTDELARSIYARMSELYFSDRSFSMDKLFDIFPEGKEMDFLNQALSGGFSGKDPNAVYTEIYINMKLHDIDDKISRYANLVKSSSDGSFHHYLAEIEILRREKEKLLKYREVAY